MLEALMITDQQPPAFSPEDLRKNFERLQADLNIVQSELEQALGVWRSILLTEKQEFQKVLEEREMAWTQEELQWQKDRQSYEQKVHELETYFKDQIQTTEKRAVHALNELDAAWQQERARWQETIDKQSLEFRQADEVRNDAQRTMEQRVEALEEENTKIKAHAESLISLDGQASAWEKEKASWQEALVERANELQEAKDAWAQEISAKNAEIAQLHQQISSIQNHVEAIDETQKNQEGHVQVYMNTLETQVSALEDFVHQVFQPRRRKTDAAHIPPVMFRPPTSRGNANNS